jgi:LPPG:FO 2-phospho-L-lactate transferase
MGVECTPEGVGGLLGARANGGVLDAWLVDETDENTKIPGLTVRAVPLWMTDEAATATMVRDALSTVGVA